jgi:hypothetical protein
VTTHLAGRRASVISPPRSTGGWRASARAAGLRPSLTPRPRSRDPHARSSEDRALPCDGGGRWFESSRAFYADVAQPEEHRVASPGRPVRSGPSACVEGLWCNRQHGELQPRWSGFEPWQACFSSSSRADVVRFSGKGGNPAERARLPHRTATCGSGLHATTATTPLLRADSVRLSTSHRQVAGSNPARSSPCSGSSADRAVPGRTHTTAAVHSPTPAAGRIGTGLG